MLVGIEWVIVGAGGGLLAAHLGSLFFLPPGVRDESAPAPASSAQSPPNVTVHGRDRPDRVPGPEARVPGLDVADDGGFDAVADAAEPGENVAAHAPYVPAPQPPDAYMPAPQPPDAYMPAPEHADHFIRWATTDDEGRVYLQRRRASVLFENYLQWCIRANVVPLPERTWQTAMKQHPRVAAKREPRKCPATGRILRKPSGAPERDTVYTIRPPRAEPALPGKVPVADLVPVREMRPPAKRHGKQAAGQAAVAATLASGETEEPQGAVAPKAWASEAPARKRAA